MSGLAANTAVSRWQTEVFPLHDVSFVLRVVLTAQTIATTRSLVSSEDLMMSLSQRVNARYDMFFVHKFLHTQNL